MSILLLGDSHADIFTHLPNVNRFDPVLFTTYRFTNPDDLELWNRLDNWFSTNPSNILIITSGEIDIRAHYWRHIPRHYNNALDIVKYIDSMIIKFYNKLIEVCEKYKIEKVIVWGQPVAGEKAEYNNQHPFGGSSQTRNQLIHMWNIKFVNLIKDDNRIKFTTAYYNFINPSNYATLTPSPSHDGVHWHNNFGPTFWNDYIMQAEEKNIVIPEHMINDNFDITETVSEGTQQYDTWARTDQITDITLAERHIEIKGVSYSWVRSAFRSILPNQYNELALMKV